ncbi:AAA family ATPase [Clostridium sp. AL.422]|uniref:ParA family protein n=1 Tax=Clostridium TaxID=1485 RepID=UPI00293DFD80|nr:MULTISPECIES: AAA family ATPase [unclassified Clostridium]MDV4151802.1 AAA family ATPase [Clostridium sp. AL.422]
MAKKIFVGNYKGGVGKTTSIYQIGMHIAKTGKKVLLIDLDPQCSLSEICIGKYNTLDDLKINECLNYIYDIWIKTKEYPNIEFNFNNDTLIKRIPIELNIYLDYIPSNIFYSGGGLDEIAMRLKDDFEDLAVLQQFIQKQGLDNVYDYILFDCPPSNNIITQGAFLLSDYFIIPTIVQAISIRGVAHYIKTIERIYKKYCEEYKNADIARLLFGEKSKFLGIFQTLKKGSVNNNSVLNELNAMLDTSNVETVLKFKGKGPYLFDSIIKNYEDIARNTAEGNIVSEYESLTNEIINLIE